MPAGNSPGQRHLRRPAWAAVSSGGDGGTAGASRTGAREGLLLVVELDVGLVQQGNVKAEGEAAGRRAQERKARVPAVQVALQADRVVAELPGVEVVVRIPV